MKNSQKGSVLRSIIITVCVIFVIGIVAIIVLYSQTKNALNEARQNSYQNEPAPSNSNQVSVPANQMVNNGQSNIYDGGTFFVEYPVNSNAETDSSNANYVITNFKIGKQMNSILGVIIYKNGFTSIKAEIDKITANYGPTATYGAPVKISNIIVAGINVTKVDYKVSGINMSQIFLETSNALYVIRSVGIPESQFAIFYNSFKLSGK